MEPLQSPKPELLDWSILFSLVKLVTVGRHWARSTKRKANRGGFETVPKNKDLSRVLQIEQVKGFTSEV